ncbi:NAD(P)-binding protein [uncultured Clostridium sp.]|uniref:NAD(P)-binding protein n=1 Tax=uncultured Clostridium sp. TaxID=59620 RepID=UPI00280B5B2A|nr:NAD(P)-binding protein [uncultured Clostridium sp.]
MNRLINTPIDKAQETIDELYGDLQRRIAVSPKRSCPVDLAAAFLRICQCHTCGKCVPCRIGLKQLENLIDDVLEGRGTEDTLKLIQRTAEGIADSADCALGYEAAEMVLTGIKGFRDDYELHISGYDCVERHEKSIPCTEQCPAEVDIPGYIALVEEGRYADAVRLIRKDNPLPLTCALVCEHPCESKCRRNNLDYSVNIRGLKRTAVEEAGYVPIPKPYPPTDKSVAIVGGGPSGLTAAYYLSLMGHKVTIFEKRKKLGGMLQYGIPNYRLPKDMLEREIRTILSNGVEVKTEVSIGKDILMEELREKYDAVYVSIGAHGHKKLGIPGEDSPSVISAVQLLREVADDKSPDFRGKSIVVIGGGNVAMDAARTSIRLGAYEVNIVYRRRKIDMTALADEIEGAIAEGCEVIELMAPISIEEDGKDKIRGAWFQPQIIGPIENRRAKPLNSKREPEFIPCDIVIVAVGQDIESKYFENCGISTKRGRIIVSESGEVCGEKGIFAVGDCVTGPSTVIKAIASGKVAAANIDSYFGYKHIIKNDVEIPPIKFKSSISWGRSNMYERSAKERVLDFNMVEKSLTLEEAKQEAGRCLRCDHLGCGAFKGGRVDKW